MKFDLFQYLAAIAFIYIYGRIGIHIVPGIGRYFINESWWLFRKDRAINFGSNSATLKDHAII